MCIDLKTCYPSGQTIRHGVIHALESLSLSLCDEFHSALALGFVATDSPLASAMRLCLRRARHFHVSTTRVASIGSYWKVARSQHLGFRISFCRMYLDLIAGNQTSMSEFGNQSRVIFQPYRICKIVIAALACFSQATSFQSLQSARNITSSSSSPEKGALLANKTANTNPPLSRHLPSKHLSAHLQQIPHHLHHWFHGLHLHLQHAHHLLHVAPPDDKPIEKTVSCLFLRYFFGSRGQIALGLVSISFGRLQVTCEATPPTCLSKRMGLPSIKSPHRQMFAFAAL